MLDARIFIFEHARARSMLDFFILDATLGPTHDYTGQVKMDWWGWKTLYPLTLAKMVECVESFVKVRL